MITTWVDERNATMSTLYGNDIAVGYARTTAGSAYPAGAALSLVTWKQQEDERWFGANIPSTPVSIEVVTAEELPDKTVRYSYQEFQGNPLRLTATSDGSTPGGRTAYIVSQRAAVMP